MTDSPSLVVGVPTQTEEFEKRVAIVPSSLARLKKLGCDVHVESGAGRAAGIADEAYSEAGATIVDRETLLANCDLLVGVTLPWTGEAATTLREGQVVIGCCDPLWEPEKFRPVAERNITTFALELLPRITRAQSMDILSSMATCAGLTSNC